MPNQENINMESMLKVGTILHGTYRIDGYLSSGGFGNTYVATHINFNEKYAIKEFFMKGVNERDGNNTTVSVSNNEKVTEFTEQLEKFKKEARRLRRLNNPHIVRVYDLFDENGTAYYVMDYINGENLKERLKRTGQPISEPEATKILEQVLDALKEVHSQGIWHLDLKPANVMVDQTGTVKLIDFGASKQFNSKTGGALSTSSVTYTNGFAPIEQMEKSYEKLGPWTDFYALGATIYNVISNQRPPMPSDINDDRTPDKHLSLPLPFNTSDKMRELLLWLMKTNRKERPESVDQITEFMWSKAMNGAHDVESTILSKKAAVLDSRNQENSATLREDEDEDSESSAENAWKTKKAILIAACAGLLLAVGLYFMFNRGSSKSEQTTVVEDSLVVKNVVDSVLTIPLGECSYTGTVNKNGVPDGKGTAVFTADGQKLVGSFENGNVDGDSIHIYYANGNTFVGSFKNNQLHHGRFTWVDDGSYFEGFFTNGQPNMKKGAMYNKKGKRID